MSMNAPSQLNRFLNSKTLDPKTLPAKTEALTTKILDHLTAGRLSKAVLVLFASPDPFKFSLYGYLFQLCGANRAIVEARKVESHLIIRCPNPPAFLRNRAIECYGKCGCLADARELFDEMPQRDGGSWNAMITAYAQSGQAQEALGLFSLMNKSGVSPNQITFASVLGSCAALLAVYVSRQIHGLLVKFGLCSNVILSSSLVDVYGKCKVISDMRRMFDEIQNPNAVSWNVIVRRHLDLGNEKEALFMFSEMIRNNAKPLTFTVSNSLIACSSLSALKQGSQIHAYSMKMNMIDDDVVLSSLLDMYSKCGDLESAEKIFNMPGSKNLINWTSMVSGYAIKGRTREARELFDKMPERNIVSWNAMLAGYTRFSQWEEALDLIIQMRKETKNVDHITIATILNVSAGLSDLELGKQVHGFVYRHHLYSSPNVVNALLNMYGRCGNLRSAQKMFFRTSHLRDSVSWNNLLASHARHGLSEEAMMIFWKMLDESRPSKFTFATLLAACANIFALELGKQIHAFMIRNEYEIDLVVRGALLDMYSKCRLLDYAIRVFSLETTRDLILWNSILLGCYYNGRGKNVIELFELMEKEGVKPDHISFRALLCGCMSAGYAELAREYFDAMSEKYCIIPRLEHYDVMIEIYGELGLMDELEDFVKKMPFDPTVQMLTSVFHGCRKHSSLRLGEWAASKLNELNPSHPFRFELVEES